MKLRSAASSISFNIDEGCNRELTVEEKARSYRMARRSATESAAMLDACRVKSSGSGSGSGSGST